MNEFLSTDRCDRCGAQAYVRFVNSEGFDLDMCGHHTNKYADDLNAQGFEISLDTRELLNRRAVGAEVS
jgi:hypothetical protein